MNLDMLYLSNIDLPQVDFFLEWNMSKENCFQNGEKGIEKVLYKYR